MEPGTLHNDLHHPDPIVRAKVIESFVEQFEGEYVCGSGKDFRDWLVERANLPISGKTVDRYLRLLETPKAVQRAVSGKEMTMKLALQVANLPEAAQQQIVAGIDAGGSPKTIATDVVRGITKSTLPEEGTPEAAYRHFLLCADRTLRAVEGNEDDVVDKVKDSISAVEILDRTQAFAARMKRKESEVTQRRVLAIGKVLTNKNP